MTPPAQLANHMDETTWFPFGIIIVNWTIRILLGLRIVLRRSSVPVALAWLAVVMFAPIVGLVLYLLIGENRLGRLRIRRYEALTQRIEVEALRAWKHDHFQHQWEPRDDLYAHLARTGSMASGLPPLGGNALELLSVKTEMLDRLAEDIDRAESHCHLLYYIWMDDACGATVGEACIRAAQRGVTCRVLVDAVGSKDFLGSELARRMRDGGVQVVAALPVNPLRMLLARLDLRNHRKLAVIDGRIGYAGSQNVTVAECGVFLSSDRVPLLDATVRIVGPAVYALQTVFMHDWLLDVEEPIGSLEDLFPPQPAELPGTSALHVIPSRPDGQRESLHQALLATIYAAREELLLTTPYFVPDEAMVAALRMAAMRGVAVTIVVPDRVDAPFVVAAGRAHFAELMEAGVRVREYSPGLLHAKVLTADRRLGIIGSANFDMRSFWLNFELTLFIYDDDFASMLRYLQMEYVEASEEIALKDWLRRPFPQRLLEGGARLLGPLL